MVSPHPALRSCTPVSLCPEISPLALEATAWGGLSQTPLSHFPSFQGWPSKAPTGFGHLLGLQDYGQIQTLLREFSNASSPQAQMSQKSHPVETILPSGFLVQMGKLAQRQKGACSGPHSWTLRAKLGLEPWAHPSPQPVSFPTAPCTAGRSSCRTLRLPARA